MDIVTVCRQLIQDMALSFKIIVDKLPHLSDVAYLVHRCLLSCEKFINTFTKYASAISE